MKRTIHIALNENGRVIGQHHHRSTISDATIKQIRDLHEYEGLSYGQIAKRFSLDKGVVGRICRYERRNQLPREWRRVSVDEEAKGETTGTSGPSEG